MFRCLGCGRFTALPQCVHCGYVCEAVDGIQQLTHDPNANFDDSHGVKYIGYDRVGTYYQGGSGTSPSTGSDWVDAECDARSMVIGEKIAGRTGRGTLLDLGCGDGAYTVPAALRGCTVIAGDISHQMLRLLLKKAQRNRVQPSRITACRMNALSIPLAEASVDGVILNNVLHLISEPERVIAEVHRVLKPGGSLIMEVNSSGVPDGRRQAIEELNKQYDERQQEFHRRYWGILEGLGIQKTLYSWRFDQFAACEAAFRCSDQIYIPFAQHHVHTFGDDWLYRFEGKGFSVQQGVPDDVHSEVFAQVVAEFANKYGRHFGDLTCEWFTDGVVLRVFRK